MNLVFRLAAQAGKMASHSACWGFPVLVLPEKTYLFALINPLLAKLVLSRLLDVGLIPSGKAAQKDSSLFLIAGGVT